MGSYSEVKIFRLSMETTRCDLFVSTHARFAVDIFRSGGFVDAHAVKCQAQQALATHIVSNLRVLSG
jgi:hypothetical protein